MLKKYSWLLPVVLLAAFGSCTKSNNAPAKKFFHEYFPLKLGNTLIYDVDSTVYNNFNNSVTTFIFQLKDSTASVFLNSTGDSVYRIERYKKESGATVWTYQKTLTRLLKQRNAQETIDNQTFVRLVFPPEKGLEWNGNSMNTLGKQIYNIESYPETLTVNNTTFDSVLVVKQIEETNLIREDIARESYVKNIGLVSKEVTAVDKDFDTGRITHGSVYTLKLTAF